jgi:hypothetical protein
VLGVQLFANVDWFCRHSTSFGSDDRVSTLRFLQDELLIQHHQLNSLMALKRGAVVLPSIAQNSFISYYIVGMKRINKLADENHK